MKRPAFQFYPADWQKDAALQSCSIGARGLWIEMLCIMHQCDPYGHLAVNGKPMTNEQLARLVGDTPAATKRALAELDAAAVFSRDDVGCIFSRRMVKDEHIRNVRAEAGKLGGNPSLLGEKDKQKVKQTDNHADKQSPTPSSSSSSSPSVKAKEAAAPPDPLWGEGLQVLTAASVSIETARAFIGKCLQDWPADTVLDALQESRGTADPRAYTKRLLAAKPRKPGRGADPTRGAV